MAISVAPMLSIYPAVVAQTCAGCKLGMRYASAKTLPLRSASNNSVPPHPHKTLKDLTKKICKLAYVVCAWIEVCQSKESKVGAPPHYSLWLPVDILKKRKLLAAANFSPPPPPHILLTVWTPLLPPHAVITACGEIGATRRMCRAGKHWGRYNPTIFSPRFICYTNCYIYCQMSELLGAELLSLHDKEWQNSQFLIITWL